jgi:hypothetical protein
MGEHGFSYFFYSFRRCSRPYFSLLTFRDILLSLLFYSSFCFRPEHRYPQNPALLDCFHFIPALLYLFTPKPFLFSSRPFMYLSIFRSQFSHCELQRIYYFQKLPTFLGFFDLWKRCCGCCSGFWRDSSRLGLPVVPCLVAV